MKWVAAGVAAGALLHLCLLGALHGVVFLREGDVERELEQARVEAERFGEAWELSEDLTRKRALVQQSVRRLAEVRRGIREGQPPSEPVSLEAAAPSPEPLPERGVLDFVLPGVSTKARQLRRKQDELDQVRGRILVAAALEPQLPRARAELRTLDAELAGLVALLTAGRHSPPPPGS